MKSNFVNPERNGRRIRLLTLITTLALLLFVAAGCGRSKAPTESPTSAPTAAPTVAPTEEPASPAETTEVSETAAISETASVSETAAISGTSSISETAAISGTGMLDLRLLETTDIHVYLMNFDYYRDIEDDTVGLAKTATLIKQAREEVTNSILVDNGDLLQGNPMGDFIANQGIAEGDIHPVYKAMNLLNYDVGTLGNHEFNYGLDFLKQALAGAEFPYVAATLIDAESGEPYIDPYLIKDYTFTDRDGNEQQIKIGFIGFAPPQIMQWDKNNLEGKVDAPGIVETAKKFIPEMKEEGADLIVALTHSGLTVAPPEGMDENAVYYLADVPDIDVIVFGHAHQVFPGPDFQDLPEIDNDKGTVKGIPAVMPGFWGNHLGVIDLTLQNVDGEWQVVDSQSEARPIFEEKDGETVSLVETDQEIVDAVSKEHEATRAWLNEPFGETEVPINSFFALVQDDPSIQIVTDAQRWYAEKIVHGTELEGIPMLSVGAPFKAGRGGPNDYTDIPAGPIAYKNVADLYIFPNTVKVLKISGADVREWLEMAAGQFNQIDPASTDEQFLIDTTFPTYNFDVIDGVTYEMDVTQPARYNKDGELVNPDSNRIVNLSYNGEPVADDQEFLVVSNNYRSSGGGHFPGITGDKIVVDAPDANRDVLANYIIESEVINPAPDMNWKFSPISDTVNVFFLTSPSESAMTYGEQFPNITCGGEVNSDGYAICTLDMSE